MEAPSSPETGPLDRSERIAAWLLGGPLSALLVALMTLELATWIPHYLTWPWFADLDVFATAAQAWDAGLLPYRDTLGNNFPGTIYLFWALGKAFGWGRTSSIFAADAAFVVLLGTITLAWSRRRFGRILPGAIGYLTFLAYYLSLDYSQAAQRDWHGPFFAVSGLLIAEAFPNRTGRLVSALALAVALTFRPQTVLFLPAMVLALDEGVRKPGGSLSTTMGACLRWGVALALFLALTFAPLALAGVLPAFLQGVRLAAYGGDYNTVTAASFLKELLIELAPLKIGAVLAAIVLLVGRAGVADRRLAATWLVATLAVLFYKPMSPRQHAYLNHPLMLVWSIDVAVLAQLVLRSGAAPSYRLAVVLLLSGLGVTGRPRFCNPVASLNALTDLRYGRDPAVSPLGYAPNPTVGKAALYPWKDYRSLLAYIREETPATTRVANVLKGLPAITGPTGRLSALPAESIAWLYTVRNSDEGRFAESLEQTPDSVVVWSPPEERLEPNFRLDHMIPVIRRLYEPAARFGDIEVWRRKPQSSQPSTAPGQGTPPHPGMSSARPPG